MFARAFPVVYSVQKHEPINEHIAGETRNLKQTYIYHQAIHPAQEALHLHETSVSCPVAP